MRILHVIPQFPYFGGRTIVGGHASCLLSLALAQHHAGCDVTIVSYIAGIEGLRPIDDGPPAYSLFSKARTRTVSFGLKFYRSAIAWLGPRRNSFDVVHVHSGFADYFLVSGKIKSKLHLPTLHTLYCPIPERGGRWRLPGAHTLICRWAHSLDWRGGMSDNVARSMSDYGLQNVCRVRPALDSQRLATYDGAGQVRRELGLDADDLMVLFVGNAKPQKNAIGLLRAFREIRPEFPNAKLVITTELKHSSSDADVARLVREIARLDLESSVIQKGIVENMPALMHACDVLAAPFLDTFGPSDYFMAVLEAMACGKPVVCSNVGGMPEVISNDVGRLVDPRDTQSIAQGLRDFLCDRDLRVQTGSNAQSLVQDIFDPGQIVKEYETIYRSIAT